MTFEQYKTAKKNLSDLAFSLYSTWVEGLTVGSKDINFSKDDFIEKYNLEYIDYLNLLSELEYQGYIKEEKDRMIFDLDPVFKKNKK